MDRNSCAGGADDQSCSAENSKEIAARRAMGIFNAPTPLNNHEWIAVKAALTMQELITRKGLQINIGLHTGEAGVGNIGSQQLHAYTAIGDTVNVAARLQAQAHDGQLVISDAIYEHLRDRTPTRLLGDLHLKGRENPVIAYEVLHG